jgi:glycerol uptake facilitator-like aquaporin
MDAHTDASRSRRKLSPARKRAWVSEFAATTVLLFAEVLLIRLVFDPNAPLARALPGMPARLTVIGTATGLLIAVLIISPAGRSSGGHINPAVTVTFWLLRAIPGRDAVAYVAAQLCGSVIGVLLGRLLLGRVVAGPPVRYAVIQPVTGWSAVAVFVGEAVSLAVLMAGVVYFLSRPALTSWTPVVVGFAVAVLIIAGGLSSGGSFNPARQFGPALFAHQWRYLEAYLVAPVVGGVALAGVMRLARSPRPLTCVLCGTRATVHIDDRVAAGERGDQQRTRTQ